MMDIAKITSKGQITIPIDIRRKLNLKDGDKIIFLEKDGQVFFKNATEFAFDQIQDTFKGEAERLGLNDEDDVVSLVKKIRKERWENKNEDNV